MVKAFGSFSRQGIHILRNSAYLQWGKSTQTIGACLMLNPGAATLKSRQESLCNGDSVDGELELDETMKQLVKLVEELYSNNHNLSGRLHIYNLFTLRLSNSNEAIAAFGKQECGDYTFSIPEQELRKQLAQSPWILMGYGCKLNKKLKIAIKAWNELISELRIPILGKQGAQVGTYHHPLPKLQANRAPYRLHIVNQYAALK